MKDILSDEVVDAMAEELIDQFAVTVRKNKKRLAVQLKDGIYGSKDKKQVVRWQFVAKENTKDKALEISGAKFYFSVKDEIHGENKSISLDDHPELDMDTDNNESSVDSKMPKD